MVQTAHSVSLLRNIAFKVWIFAALFQRYTLNGIETERGVKFRG